MLCEMLTHAHLVEKTAEFCVKVVHQVVPSDVEVAVHGGRRRARSTLGELVAVDLGGLSSARNVKFKFQT